MEFARKDGMYVAEWDKYRNTGWNTTIEMQEKQVQAMYMSQVEGGAGMQDAYVHVKLKKKRNEAVIEGLVVTDDIAREKTRKNGCGAAVSCCPSKHLARTNWQVANRTE